MLGECRGSPGERISLQGARGMHGNAKDCVQNTRGIQGSGNSRGTYMSRCKVPGEYRRMEGNDRGMQGNDGNICKCVQCARGMQMNAGECQGNAW